MTRDEFSGALRGALRGLDEAEIGKSVQFYDELIADHMDEGMAEAAAVAAVGSVEDIAREVLLEMPVAQLVRRRVRARRRSFWGITAIVLGSPVWLPLLAAAVALLITAYALLWTLDAALWAVVVSLFAAAAGLLINIALSAAGLMFAGAALAATGAGILGAFAVWEITKGCALIGRGLWRAVKRSVVGGRKGEE